MTAEEIERIRYYAEKAGNTQVLAIIEERKRFRERLKRFEWSASDGTKCPACGAYNPKESGKPPPPHEPDCEFAALIGAG